MKQVPGAVFSGRRPEPEQKIYGFVLSLDFKFPFHPSPGRV
jgi:hypothetical protein